MNKQVPELTSRLACIASNVKSGGIVADIGCDHGMVSIYLVRTGLAKGAIAMDINKGPLERAKKNISLYGMEEYISLRLSDGAKELKKGEADTIIMSGMGGTLITGILKESAGIVKGVGELVLSPQSEMRIVRHFLHDNGFRITDEDMVKERGKFYVIIRAVPGSQHYPDEEGYIYGEYLINKKNKILKEYLLKEKNRIGAVIGRLGDGGPADVRKAILKEEYGCIEKILKNL